MQPLYYASPIWFTAMIPIALLYSLTANMIHVQSPQTIISLPDDRQGIAIVTGANTGIGWETARSLAVDHQYSVVLACRSYEKGQAAVQAIQREYPQAQVRVEQLDLSDFHSIRSFVRLFQTNSIQILVNNAGRNTDPSSPTKSLENRGWNVLFQTNFVGHFYLTQLLLQQQSFVKDARLVQVSSVMHHFAPDEEKWIDMNYWKEVAKPTPNNDTIQERYTLSKLAAILFSIQLNRLYGDRLQSIAVNPGAVNSDIWRTYPNWIRRFFSYIYLDNRQGAQTSIAAAVGTLVSNHSKNEALYLQPYQQFWWQDKIPFPAFEMLGPFVGYTVTPPRLRLHDYQEAAEALWMAMEELLTNEQNKVTLDAKQENTASLHRDDEL